MVRGGGWWAMTIGWGVITSALISAVLIFVLFVFFRIWLPVI